MRTGILLLSVVVVFQFLMELTLGRIALAPSMLPLALVYLGENRGGNWVVDGAFWSGLSLDLLLHQPPGSTSLALIVGLWVAMRIGRLTAGEGTGNLLLMAAMAVAVSDVVFMVVASRPFGSGLGAGLLLAFPRAALTTGFGVLLLAAGNWVSTFRERRTVG